MAKLLRMANAAVNAGANAMAALANNGYLRIYDGTQAATGDTAVGAQVLIAECRMGATAFGSSVAGVITANAVTGDASANNAGTPTWFRLLQSDGTTPLWDGTAGASGCDLNLGAATIAAGIQVNITGFTHTVTK